MSTILAIYSAEPSFPVQAQHPDAVRYHIGEQWIDALDGEPTQAEIDAMINPPSLQRLKDIADDAGQQNLLELLRSGSPAEIDQWVMQREPRDALKAVLKFLVARRVFQIGGV
jgi:hypothetical protein